MTEDSDNDGGSMLLEDQIAAIIDDDDAPSGEVGEGEGAGTGTGTEEAAAEGAAGAEGEGGATEGEEGAGEGAAEGDAGAQDEKKRQPWQAKRFGKLTSELAEARKAAADAKAELDAIKAGAAGEGGGKLFTEAEVDARVKAEAAQIATANLLDQKLEGIFESGNTKFKDFEARIDSPDYAAAMGDDMGKKLEFLGVLAELPNGDDVIYALGGDLDQMAEIMEMGPAKMGLELGKLSVKLAEAAKPKPKPITKAPAPITPLETKARTELAMDDDDMPMEEFGKRLFRGMAERGG